MMRVMTRAYIIPFFISYLLFVDAASAAAFPLTRWLETVMKVPKTNGISYIRPSSAPLKIGDTFPDASKLKRYLEILNHFNDVGDRLIDKFSDDDKFSDSLQAGLKKFQATYNLSVTGLPDKPTVDLIKRPRCGVPDVINGTPTLSAPFNWPWPKGKKRFTYAFSLKNLTKPYKDVFSSAFSRWELVTGLSFTETPSFSESDIRIEFSKWNETDWVAGSGFPNSTTSSWGAIYFNLDGMIMEAKKLDIETVTMHQIGHMLGFGHTTKEEEAVMFPFMEPRKRKVKFATDESERIQQVFRSDYDASSHGRAANNDTSSYGGAAGGVWPGWVGLGIALLFF